MRSICYAIWILFIPVFSYAQDDNLTAGQLLSEANTQAREHKNYPQAIRLVKESLRLAPNTEASIFLGRLYAWSGQTDSARTVFEELEAKGVQDEDFFLAYASAQYWDQRFSDAEALLDRALSRYPASKDLWLLRARVSLADNRMDHAQKSIDTLLALDPRHTEGRALAFTISRHAIANMLGLTYNFVYFDKQFDDPWHLAALSYQRQTSFGPLIARLTYANKFRQNALQYELEAYPRISRMFYLYAGAAYSDEVGVFPRFRTGVSLYANLPRAWEAEIGYRQLYFNDYIWTYTTSLGKYYQNYWFNVRTYLTPATEHVAQTYQAMARYYIGGAFDYLGLTIGTGISPDDNRNNLLGDEFYKLRTFRLGSEYNFTFGTRSMVNLSVSYYNQEFRANEKGNQFDILAGYFWRF